MEKKVTLCDICSQRVAGFKCGRCEKDMCTDCSQFMKIDVERAALQISFTNYKPDKADTNVRVCSKCEEEIMSCLKGIYNIQQDRAQSKDNK